MWAYGIPCPAMVSPNASQHKEDKLLYPDHYLVWYAEVDSGPHIVIMMVIMTIICRVSIMLLFLWFSLSDCVSAMSHPKSGILLAGTVFLPSLVFPTCSSSYSLQTFFCHRYFLHIFAVYLGCVAVVVFDFYPVLSQKSYYVEIIVLWLECFQCVISNKYIVIYFKFFWFFWCFAFLVSISGFLGLFRLCATTLYSLVISPTLIIPSSVPRYLGFSDSSRVCFTAASHTNMRKNSAIPEDSVGKKLYAAVAFHTRLSHSMQVSSCFAIVALRNLWNPPILPLHCGEKMGVNFCSISNFSNTSVQGLFLN